MSARARLSRVAWSIPVMAMLGVALLCWNSTLDVLGRWGDRVDTTYSHGYLILAVFVWLLWARRDVVSRELQLGAPAAAGFVLLLLAGMAWLVATLAGFAFAAVLLLPVIAWATQWAGSGWRLARTTAFPFAYLYFALPIWVLVNPLARGATVVATRGMLGIVGIPAYFQGNFVQIPEGVFEITDGCSGLHFLIVALALGSLLGELREDGWRNRLRILVVSVVFAALVNWIRVFCVILAGHLTNMQHFLVKVDHRYFGWALFALALPLYFLFLRRVAPPGEDAPAHAFVERGASTTVLHKWRFAGWVTVMALLVIPALAERLISQQVLKPAALELRGASNPWQGPFATHASWQPIFHSADLEVAGTYHGASGDVRGYAALYLRQQQGREIGGYGNSIAGSGRIVEVRRSTAAGNDVAEAEIVDAQGMRWVVWYHYQVGDRIYLSPLRAQLAYAVQTLLALRPAQSRVSAFASRCAHTCAAAHAVLEDFAPQLRDVAGVGS